MLRQGGDSFHFTEKGVFKLNTRIQTTNIRIKYFLRTDTYNTIHTSQQFFHHILFILYDNSSPKERKDRANIIDLQVPNCT